MTDDRRSVYECDVRAMVNNFAHELDCLDEVRFLGRCPSCSKSALYCLHGSEELRDTEGGYAIHDYFLHFCGYCRQHRYSWSVSDLDWDCGELDSSAHCPFCGHKWHD